MEKINFVIIYLFHLFCADYYPNMFMSVPNGPQANPQQFSNKLPYNNFATNNTNNINNGYDDQNKDFVNYGQQQQQQQPQQQQQQQPSQMKSSGSGLNNVVAGDIGSVGVFQKQAIDKQQQQQQQQQQTNAGYHTPPPNYTNSLLNAQHPNVNLNASTAPLPPPPAQYAYITGLMGAPGTGMVHAGMQPV